MKYCVTIIQPDDNACSAYLYSKKSEAKARFHHEMEYANNANVTTVCFVTDSNGGYVCSDKYTAVPADAQDGENE